MTRSFSPSSNCKNACAVEDRHRPCRSCGGHGSRPNFLRRIRGWRWRPLCRLDHCRSGEPWPVERCSSIPFRLPSHAGQSLPVRHLLSRASERHAGCRSSIYAATQTGFAGNCRSASRVAQGGDQIRPSRNHCAIPAVSLRFATKWHAAAPSSSGARKSRATNSASQPSDCVLLNDLLPAASVSCRGAGPRGQRSDSE